MRRRPPVPDASSYAVRVPTPFDQSEYQVRFDWGEEGMRRLAPSDVVVVVDVLLFCSDVADAVAAGRDVPVADAADADGAMVADAAGRSGALVLAGCLRNASAVAEAVLAEQLRRGERTSIAVIAAGECAASTTASGAAQRFTVEDQFGAGAVIAALADRGVDHSSPEAAAAAESFRALRPALRHLLTASGSGRALSDRIDDVRAAARLDAVDAAPVLRSGLFVRGSSGTGVC